MTAGADLRIVSLLVEREGDGWKITIDSDLDPWSTYGIIEGALDKVDKQLYPIEEES